MEKAFEKLEELYKNELNSHDFKLKNRDDNLSLKMNKLLNDNNYFRNIKITAPLMKNIISMKNRCRKKSYNANYDQIKNKLEDFSDDNDIENIKEEIEEINNKKNNNNVNSKLKVSKTIKNCGENINKAKIILFNKDKGNNNIRQPMKSAKKVNSKCLSCNKRESVLKSQSSKKAKRYLELDKEQQTKNENDKRKKSNFRSDNYSNRGIRTDNFDSNKNNNNVISQFKYNNSIVKSNINDNKKGNKYSTTNGNKNNINLDKIKINNNKIKEIIYDSDNEVENNLLSLLDKTRKKKKRNSVETKKRKHYGTQEIIKDKLILNMQNSYELKKHKSNDIGKTSNFNSISIIKKTEINHYNDDELIKELNDNENWNWNNIFKNITEQKVVSFEYNENNNLIKYSESNNKPIRSKSNKKFIIYNNINYFKNTQREENLDENNKNNNQIYIIDNINKNDVNMVNNNKEIKNNSVKSNCLTSLFNCCFLSE